MALAGMAAALWWQGSRRPRIPAGVEPVRGWDLRRYMGRWYEVARVEHGFEKGLERTQAEYTALPDGSVHVLNRGYDAGHRRWKSAEGKARLVQGPDVAALKVSFFGPFYGGYNVVALDEHYRWAMVIGSDLRYFWILSRTPDLPSGVAEPLMAHARQLGVPVARVQWVLQDGVNPTGSW
jgi:apolipoprotein D and lipocalin family protein